MQKAILHLQGEPRAAQPIRPGHITLHLLLPGHHTAPVLHQVQEAPHLVVLVAVIHQVLHPQALPGLHQEVVHQGEEDRVSKS